MREILQALLFRSR